MQGLPVDAIGARQVDRRFVGVGAVAVAVTQGVRSLVANVGNGQRQGWGKGALHGQVPGIDRRELSGLIGRWK